MKPFKVNRRRRQAGFTIMESAASSFVLAIAVLGLVGGVVVQRSLESSTVRLWDSVDAATTAMEDIRANSLNRWSSISSWDQHKIDPVSGESSDKTRLVTLVSDDPTKLLDGAEMWSDGAVAPNFYLVEITTESATAEFANALKMQTYVADRRGLVSAIEGAGGPSPDATMASGDASKMQATPSNATVSGAYADILTFEVTNGSSVSLEVESVVVQLGTEGQFHFVSVGGTTYYDDPGTPVNLAKLTAPTNAALVRPGPLVIQVGAPGAAPFEGQTLTLTITFTDFSRVTYQVRP